MTIKKVLAKCLIGAVLTTVLLNCSSSLLVGFPVFIYSIFSWGMFFLVVEMFVYLTTYVFLFFEIQGRGLPKICYLILIAIFLIINVIAEKFTHLSIRYP